MAHTTPPLTFLWRQSLKRPTSLWGVAIAAVFVVGVEAALPLLTKQAIDVATGESDGGTLAQWLPSLSPLAAIITVFIALALVRFAAQIGRRFFSGKLSIDVQHDLRLSILAALQRLDDLPSTA